MPDSPDLEPLFRTIIETVPAPTYVEGAPLQAHVTNLDASPFLGRLALCRVHQGTLRKGQNVAWLKRDGSQQNVKITELLVTEALERVPGESAGPGDIIAVAGIPEINIGETLADLDNPVALPADHRRRAGDLDDDRHQHVAAGRPRQGHQGHRPAGQGPASTASWSATCRSACSPTERPDAWEVQGRGELALAILVEQMRREGYELTVGKPQVVTRTRRRQAARAGRAAHHRRPEDYLGGITQLLAVRKGRMEQMINHGTGWVRMEFLVPARGLIGFRTEFMTDTRGTGIAHHVFEGYEPWAGDLRTRSVRLAGRRPHRRGDVVRDVQPAGARHACSSSRPPRSTRACSSARTRRSDDMDVNITKEKKLTNVRSATADELERLVPPRRLSLEQSLEFCREDECVEVTPDACGSARSSSTRPARDCRQARRT